MVSPLIPIRVSVSPDVDREGAFPGAPERLILSMDTLLEALEQSDRYFEYDPVTGGHTRRVKRHRHRKVFWQLSSQALHRGTVTMRRQPLVISMALQETAMDIVRMNTLEQLARNPKQLACEAAASALFQAPERLTRAAATTNGSLRPPGMA